ncbi:BadF/BadG/BcrA/BcrD ATPase family protein [Marivita sp. S0852]|uniref:BadF/BadG/BcrA/BcrD ATPase family protein n=1 Tax=Marivita sp. S0852 TaxID=3373893 RepID=UPI0039828807
MPSNTRHIFGIDGGGTGCRVSVCTASGICIGQAEGGPANVSTDASQALENICTAIQTAAMRASLGEADIIAAVAHAGLAGVLTPDQATHIQSALPFKRVRVSDDRETSTIGALGTSDGVVAAVGTGSFVAARKDGQTRFFGGWGFQLSDQASGAWLGRKALEHCVLVHDGLAAQNALSRHIMGAFQGDIVEIVRFAQKATPQDYANFAPIVVAAAQDGDVHGKQLLMQGAEYLTTCFKTTRVTDHDKICLIGGVGRHYLPYLDADIRDQVTPAQGSALDGAVTLAHSLADHLTDQR